MVIDHITSHKFSIPFYTIVERWKPTIFLFLFIFISIPHLEICSSYIVNLKMLTKEKNSDLKIEVY